MTRVTQVTALESKRISMKAAIYAGSFDPWTKGHEFVYQSAQALFDKILIIVANSAAKKTTLEATQRAQIIAHGLNPFQDWWNQMPSFQPLPNVEVIIYEDLIAEYAAKNKVRYLIRGLRSTSDFEYEFNLYFSNRALNEKLETWSVMCPPELLHCSSTFVKTVVGRGTEDVSCSFCAQSLILGLSERLGVVFDVLKEFSSLKSETAKHFSLQKSFNHIHTRRLFSHKEGHKELVALTQQFVYDRADKFQKALIRKEYPKPLIHDLWDALLELITELEHRRNNLVSKSEIKIQVGSFH